jgi:hypothetical protein
MLNFYELPLHASRDRCILLCAISLIFIGDLSGLTSTRQSIERASLLSVNSAYAQTPVDVTIPDLPIKLKEALKQPLPSHLQPKVSAEFLKRVQAERVGEKVHHTALMPPPMTISLVAKAPFDSEKGQQSFTLSIHRVHPDEVPLLIDIDLPKGVSLTDDVERKIIDRTQRTIERELTLSSIRPLQELIEPIRVKVSMRVAHFGATAHAKAFMSPPPRDSVILRRDQSNQRR